MGKKPHVLVIIDDENDKPYLTDLHERYDIDFYVLSYAQLPQKHADAIIEKCITEQKIPDGIIGIHDKPSVVASLVTDALGKPGVSPEALSRIQHKAVFARTIKKVNPDSPAISIITSLADPIPLLTYPVFMKPARGAVSVDAYEVFSENELRDRLTQVFTKRRRVADWYEEFFAPFKKENDPPVKSFLLQEYVAAKQYTVDGFVFRRELFVMGVTESVYMKDKKSFQRFDFPAVFSKKAYKKLYQILKDVVAETHYNNAAFNIEFFVTDDEKVILIEMNTRLSLQFVPLLNQKYTENYLESIIKVSLGIKPDLQVKKGQRVITSYVLRSLTDKYIERLPTQEVIDGLKQKGIVEYIHFFVAKGEKFSDYNQDAYTYRYAIINVSGKDFSEVDEKIALAKQSLQFVFRDAEKKDFITQFFQTA